VHAGFMYEDLMGIDHLEDLNVDGRVILKWNFHEWHGDVRTGFLWLRTGTGGGCV
jgi:hypothetical protein